MALVGCSSVHSRVAALRTYRAPTPVTTMKVPYPIILLHGLGQKADVWQGSASNYFGDALGLSFGGTLRVEDGRIAGTLRGNADADYYVMSFRSPYDSINAWRDELELAIDHVRRHTGADRVILIGYSMGGLAARAYLTKRFTNHHVKRLITVGTPHLGSPFAKVWTWKSTMQECAAQTNPVLSLPCKAALSAIQGTEGDVPYDAPAVRDLRRPEDGGAYLRALGKYAHPMDVEYVSVIGELDMFAEARKLSEGWVQEVLRKALAVTGGGLPELFEPGDGVVSARSQDIMNIEYFSVDPSRRRAARMVQVRSVHLDHLRSSVEIQRTSLDEKPEFKGADVVRIGDHAALVVDYTDHIPALCTLTVDVREGSGTTTTLTSAAGTSALIRTADGIISRCIVPLQQVPSAETAPVQFRIAITNTFGHVVTSTKDW
jgi:pimeloyl-ACP methyl ester carboxylesterase